MTRASLLPRNASALESALGTVAAARLAQLPERVAALWNAATCPAALLPWLAWALSVDEWSADWGAERKRAAILAARDVHRRKGTLAAVKRALAAVGQPDATVIERGDYIRRDGGAVRDASHQRQGAGGWATYRIVLQQTVTVDQAHMIRRLLAAVQRNCIALTAIDYRQAGLRRNGIAHRDGSYARGVVNTSI